MADTPQPDMKAALAEATWIVKCFEDAGLQDQPSSQYNMAKALLAYADIVNTEIVFLDDAFKYLKGDIAELAVKKRLEDLRAFAAVTKE